MSLPSGTRLGPYEIVAPLGAGGMGEVYRARDTRLDRTVAVKVLPEHLADTPDARERFDREARAISSLNHPHICVLHDVGHQGSTDYLVMEYLEGETLGKRIERGPLPAAELLRIAIEIADALEKAHRQGILHRDLKPGNIMLTKSGAKLMDFGLAKATTPPAVDLSSSPTVSQPAPADARREPLTARGTIVGTFQYMAPEQIEGKETDARSDIFSFGAVLYEMATGKKAFEGKSQASLIAAILEREPPPISTLQPMSPPALDRVVKTCLAKDPDERFQTAHDLKLQLQWIGEGGSQAGVPAPVAAHRKTRERAAWVAAAVFLILAGAAAAAYWQLARQPERAVRAFILPPEKSTFRTSGPGFGPVVVSPDGKLLVFSAASSDGVRLWVRPLDSLNPQPLAGTENATYPFWSGDSRNIGFFQDGKLKRIAVSGGPPQSLCDAPAGRGGTWSRDGVILFTPSTASPIFRVSQAGGSAEPVTKLNVARQENSTRWPFFLPDGRHFIFYGRSNDPAQTGTFLGSLDGGDPKFLLKGSGTAALYAPPGFLLFVRDGTLLAQGLDAAKGQLSGEALLVAERVEMNESTQRASFGVSENGVIAFHTGGRRGDNSILTWYDRTGKLLETVASPGVFIRPSLSPDGLKVATAVVGDQSGVGDIWVLDLRRGVKSRLTFGPGPTADPVWSPDGSRIAYSAVRQGFAHVYVRSADGSGNEETLLEAAAAAGDYPRSWSADGRFLAIERLPQGKSQYEIWILPMFGERKAFPFLQDAFNEDQPAFSPNGKWLAYRSNESGKEEIFVARFPEKSGKWQVSSGGGSVPQWRADGKELFYVGNDGKLMTVAVEEKNGSPAFSTGQPLFTLPLAFAIGVPSYDMSRDGRRILIPKLMENANPEPITLIVNWTAALGQK